MLPFKAFSGLLVRVFARAELSGDQTNVHCSGLEEMVALPWKQTIGLTGISIKRKCDDGLILGDCY